MWTEKPLSWNRSLFQIPGEEEGEPGGVLEPWKFTSSDEAEITTPILDRSAYTSAGVILSDQHQVFGYFDGILKPDGKEEIKIERNIRFAKSQE